jgi:hypothetical protein
MLRGSLKVLDDVIFRNGKKDLLLNNHTIIMTACRC